MSKQTQQFFEQLKNGEPPSLAERIVDAASKVKGLGGALWEGARPMFDHGRTELAAALFAGHAHVMYMKGEHGQPSALEQTHDRAQDQAPDQTRDEGRNAPERDGGREM